MNTEEIDERALADLCPELRAILDAELNAGNRIARAARGFYSNADSIVVDLTAKTFLAELSALPSGVSFSSKDMQCGIGDSYYCMRHEHIIIAAFR